MTSRRIDASLGKIPTTLVRRLISPLIRSTGLVDQSLRQCATEKLLNARNRTVDSQSVSQSDIAATLSNPSWEVRRLFDVDVLDQPKRKS